MVAAVRRRSLLAGLRDLAARGPHHHGERSDADPRGDGTAVEAYSWLKKVASAKANQQGEFTSFVPTFVHMKKAAHFRAAYVIELSCFSEWARPGSNR